MAYDRRWGQVVRPALRATSCQALLGCTPTLGVICFLTLVAWTPVPADVELVGLSEEVIIITDYSSLMY